jgi:F420-non-reducing hydrogenase small subunit
MGSRPKIAFYWCAGCGGCEESVFDLADGLAAVARRADIVFWPAALDTRYRDLAALDDGAIDAAFINGAVRLHAHVRMVRLLRAKSKCVIAHGACAHMGGVIGLANLSTVDQMLSCAYRQAPSLSDETGPVPGAGTAGDTTSPPLTRLLPTVQALDRVIRVDGVVPGCPPPPETMERVIGDIIDGRLPSAGAVFAHRKALCHECLRRDSKPDTIAVSRFKRLHETVWDPDICFLAQDLICLGPVTRGGCGARCIGANMPCRGCFGPTERMQDAGAGAIALLAGMAAEADDPGLTELIDSIADPTGLIYRYSLAASVLGLKEKG